MGASALVDRSASPSAPEGTTLRSFQTIWSLGDQALISISNFVTTLVVARASSPAAFGEYTVVYTALLFAVSVQTSLICQPHNVLAATRTGDDYRAFTASSARVQGVLALVSGVCALVAAWVSWQLGWDVTLLLIVLAPTVVAWEMQEFLRRVLYTEGRAGAALINDGISYGGQAAGAVALGVTGHASGLAVLIVMGVSSAVAALVGAVQVGPSLRGAWTWEAVHENWRYGKWLAASELTGNWLGDQLYVFLAIPILGFSAAGVLKAMQLLFGPIRLVIMAVNTMTPIRAVKALERGGARAFRQEYARVLLVVVPIIVAYAAVAILFAPQLLSLAYGATYLAYAQVFQIGALCMLAGSAVIVTSSILRALDATRAIFYGRLIGGIFGVALAWPVIYWLGLNGMMFALLLGSLFTLALLLHLTRQSMPRSAQPGASAISPLEARP